ncbi:MAG: c-type cytochrome biogenesis protein CcmI [Sedimentitalea sp.]
MTFWIVTGLLALTVAGTLAMALLRGRVSADAAEAYDLRVYRDQLKEVDRDVARGVLSASDGERVRTEISRRILASDGASNGASNGATDTATGAAQPPRLSTGAALALAVLVLGGAFWLYRDLGAPGYGDLALKDRIAMAEVARDTRPSQADAEATVPPQPPLREITQDYLTLLERLRDTVAERPDDLQGHMLLARNEAATGNFVAAHKMQAQVIRLKGEGLEVSDLTDYADMLILAAGGYVSPEAEGALRSALELDPANGVARYYWGLMMAQTGRPDLAFNIWNRMLREGPQDAPWMQPILAQIEEMADRAGTRFEAPPSRPPPPGPSAEDVEAAGQMSAQERNEMIQGMVARLSDRLANDGGPPQEWARLIVALSVLERSEQARAVYDNAQEVFADVPEAMSLLRDAALRAGVIQ